MGRPHCLQPPRNVRYICYVLSGRCDLSARTACLHEYITLQLGDANFSATVSKACTPSLVRSSFHHSITASYDDVICD